MSWHRPTPQRVWLAIETYIDQVYRGSPPSAVRARLDTLHAVPEKEFYESAVLEHEEVADPQRYCIRLGNPVYPHMKLVIERAPDGKGHMFRADTHDQHCVPDTKSRDYGPFCRLMEKNQQYSQAVEGAWEKAGLTTFKSYLREDLQRRAKAGG